MKFKTKISYLGDKNYILLKQMAEQLPVEVDVKHVTQKTHLWNMDKLFYYVWMAVQIKHYPGMLSGGVI